MTWSFLFDKVSKIRGEFTMLVRNSSCEYDPEYKCICFTIQRLKGYHISVAYHIYFSPRFIPFDVSRKIVCSDNKDVIWMSRQCHVMEQSHSDQSHSIKSVGLFISNAATSVERKVWFLYRIDWKTWGTKIWKKAYMSMKSIWIMWYYGYMSRYAERIYC